MTNRKPHTTYLKDYKQPDYLIHSVHLHFDLKEHSTRVTSKLTLTRNGEHQRSLQLMGQTMELCRIILDDQPLESNRYQIDNGQLTITQLPDTFTLEIETSIQPQNNTSLEGLYKSNGMFCTQCEAEGFRKITYFLDRPDVMAVYTTTIVADKKRYPVLLSNGNKTDHGELENGRHWATWHDPFPKPSYLFAMVAGDLVKIEDQFTTCSGRVIDLHIFVEAHDADKCDHAMQSLKNSMAWDEETFGLEYDLDIYMIVAVGHFNMGAMENKGLNIFNTKCILAKPETATDNDYERIEAVIAHEYFHNWTGNRVTCRDWFQLSLKEGLTVFRDQQFSADMGCRAVKRINDVRMLRLWQFTEDAGPMAHPVRPSSYIEISNFYTMTIYEKGSELIRMMHTLLGKQKFRQGIDLYFERHDGQAVTIENFVTAMEDASSIDLEHFKRWYEISGTPQLDITSDYDAAAQKFTLNIKQSCPDTPGQNNKPPLHIPVAVGLLDKDGNDLPLQLESDNDNKTSPQTTRLLELHNHDNQFHFINIPEHPTPSLLRGFSAPVKLNSNLSDEDLIFLLTHDQDTFNRWEAGQQLFTKTILNLIEQYNSSQALTLPEGLIDAIAKTINNETLDKALITEIITLPSETYLGEQMATIDVDAIHHCRQFLKQTLARELKDTLLSIYQNNSDDGSYKNDTQAISQRKIKNCALDYLMQSGDKKIIKLCCQQFSQAKNMTDAIAALSALTQRDCPERKIALNTFFIKWRNEALVLDKWFTLQAVSSLKNTFNNILRLMTHAAFDIKNPNRVRSLISAFCNSNPIHFHRADGQGYQFLADKVIELNNINPQIAARLLGALTRWHRYDKNRQALMKIELERVIKTDNLSKDVYEIASKSLNISP